jgi:hypothetical protein
LHDGAFTDLEGVAILDGEQTVSDGTAATLALGQINTV